MQPQKLTKVADGDWLDLVAHPRTGLSVSNYGYTNHPLEAVPIVDRTLDVHLLWFVVDNRFGGNIGREFIDLDPGSLLWIRPGVAHSFTIPQGLRSYHLRIDLRRGEERFTPSDPWIVARSGWELRSPLEELLQELQVQSPHRTQRLKQLVGTICLLIFRRSQKPETETALNATQRFKVRQLAVDSLRDGLTPADLASELQLSPVYFSRLFKHTYGLSPRAWLMRERLRQASTLLIETDHRISEIAHACGFQDANLFSRQFRKVYRHSPREHRRR